MHHVIQHMYLVRERSLTLPQAAQLVASPVQIQDSWTWGRFTGVFPQKENLSLLSFPSSSFPLSPSPLAEPTREFMESNKLEKIEKVAKKCNYRGLFPPSADMLTPPPSQRHSQLDISGEPGLCCKYCLGTSLNPVLSGHGYFGNQR